MDLYRITPRSQTLASYTATPNAGTDSHGNVVIWCGRIDHTRHKLVLKPREAHQLLQSLASTLRRASHAKTDVAAE